MFALAVSVFLVSIIFLIFDRIDKTIVASIGAILLIVGGVLNFEEALHFIDWETLILLIGLMITVVVAEHSGIFAWLSTKIAQQSKGSPLAIFILFTALTFFASTILNNATVVLLVVPIALALSKGLGLNSKLLVITIAIFSNIGGTLTLIGDPPNTLIGVRVGLSFNDFLANLAVPVFAMAGLIVGYLVAVNKKYFKPIKDKLFDLFVSNLIIERIDYKFAAKKLDYYFIGATCTVIFLTVVAFMFSQQIGVSVGVLGITSGILLGLLVGKRVDYVKVIKEIEWDSILFFAALFVQVGALQKVGFLDMIANYIAGFSGNFVVLMMIILWTMGLASSVINNIPFVALMIPVIMSLQEKMTGQAHLDLLWWALALGACLGGNFTVIGSSSGILAVDAAKKLGVKVSFLDFMKVGVPVSLISLIVSSVYLIVRFYYF